MKNIDELFAILSKMGICETGRRYWKMSPKNLETIIKAWKEWPEFIAEHGNDALLVLRKYITSEDDIRLMASKNIYLDTIISDKIISSDTNVSICGKTTGTIITEDYSVVKIYAYHSSNINVICGKNAIVSVESYHNSAVNIEGCTNNKMFLEMYHNSNITNNIGANVQKKQYIAGEVFNGKEENE